MDAQTPAEIDFLQNIVLPCLAFRGFFDQNADLGFKVGEMKELA